MPALDGVRVLDLSRLLPGPYATLLFADLGADVVKVEEPSVGDYLRAIPPMVGKASGSFHALNRGKRSIAVDLKSLAGRDVLRCLAARADVLLESFRPGVMDRLGLGWTALSAAHPGLVYCAISGFGSTSALADRAGHDLGYTARSGVLGYGGGDEGGPPGMPGVQVADIGASLTTAVAVLAALLERQRTGRGRFLDLSMYESSLPFLHMHLGARLAMGEAGTPLARGRETLNGGFPCYRVYRTKDGRHLAVAALEPKFWSAFCCEVGRLDLAESGWAQGEEGARVRREVEGVVAARTLSEWEALLAGKDVCCEPVREGDEIVDDPLFRERDLVAELPCAWEGRAVRYLKTPVRSKAGAERCAPALGEHTDEVLAEAGYGPDEIARLRSSGAVA